MESLSEYCVILITCPDEESAQILASRIIEQKLGACVNIVPKVTSFFSWEAKIEKEDESMLIIKSKSSYITLFETFLEKEHPYDVAECIALPLIGGTKGYMAWLEECLAPNHSSS